MARKDRTEGETAAMADGSSLTAFERARVRIDCLKIATEFRTAAKPIATLVKEAQEIENYVVGRNAGRDVEETG